MIRSQRLRARISAVILTAFLTAFGGVGADTDSWKQAMEEIDDLLVSQEWKKAEKKVHRLRNEMYLTVVGRGEGWLAMLATLHAVTLAGLGDEHQAQWMWDVALQLFPDLKPSALKRYGEVAEILSAEHPSRRDLDSDASEEEADVDPPKRIEGSRPEFPIARRMRGAEVSVEVECVLDTDGLLYDPEIIRSSGEFTLVYSALEAMGKWKFKPATLDGEPVPVLFNETIRFRVP